MAGNPVGSAFPDPYGARPSPRDIYELLRLPAVFAVGTAAVTWLIWYYTSTSCTAELAALIGCNPATIARYINVDVYGRMLTYSVLAAGVGGVWNYDMFTKMRAVIAAERSRADEAEKQLAEYRQQAEEERRLRDEERRLRDEELRREWERTESERRQERETLMAVLAEERRRSDENQQAFMATLSELTTQMTRLVERQNGDAQGGH